YYYLRYKSDNYWHHEMVEAGWDVEAWLEHSRALWHHNGQVRQLLIGKDDSVSHLRDLNAEHLAAAKRHLEAFWFIGTTETFTADALYMYGLFNFRKFHSEEQVNVTPRKDAVSKRLRELIGQQNAL